MNLRPLTTRRTLAVLSFFVLTLGSASTSLASLTWKDVQFGGFASQGFLVNTGNNDYLGNSSDGTFDFREFAANASYATGKWRLGAQAFGQRLGDYGHDTIAIDWATVDYQATQWLGVRAGRVKLPRGLYNEALDLDAVRPFVLLPQSVYDNRLRDFTAAFNGVMIYGNVSLKQAGSLDYRLFYGKMPLDTNSGASDYFNIDAPFPNIEIGIKSAQGGSLFWNTPVAGLRVGYSYNRFNDFNTVRFVPFRNANTYKDTSAYDRHLLSVEYIKGDWVLAAEAGQEEPTYNVHFLGQPPYAYLYAESKYYYFSASRRINSRLELGAYYSYSDFQQVGVGTPVQMPLTKQGDYALSVRFDVNEHLLFKLEGHYMDGSGKIFDLPSKPQPPASRDDSWFMLAAKATLLF